eukprot:55149-Chlamydomonas_euryale.AAC.2
MAPEVKSYTTTCWGHTWRMSSSPTRHTGARPHGGSVRGPATPRDFRLLIAWLAPHKRASRAAQHPPPFECCDSLGTAAIAPPAADARGLLFLRFEHLRTTASRRGAASPRWS